MSLWTQTHYLYRCYDEQGDLLYIGVTSNLVSRMHAHRYPPPSARKYPAGNLYRLMATWTAQRYPDRRSALAAEREAIRAEHPLLNIKCKTPQEVIPA